MEPRVYKTMRLMTADPRRQIRFNDLARSLNLSASRLRHLFKQETGMSPLKYVRAQRMQKARELLETTFLNVKEVMLKVGFRHRGYFVRSFKKVYGLSPSKYRLQYMRDKEKKVQIVNI